MTTIRRELIQKFKQILEEYRESGVDFSWDMLPEKLADAALELKGFKISVAKFGIDWAIAAGEDVDPDTFTSEVTEKEALDAFEDDMRTPDNWQWYPAKTSEERAWKELRDFVVARYKENKKCFEAYQTWRTQPYAKGAMSNLAIKRNPENFPASWTDFLASNAMYGKKDKTERRPYEEDANGIPMSF